MNGRLYDPVLGRMLSPDPYIQLPGFAQNYNRYSYVWNNPLKFTDPNGEFVFTALALLIPGGQAFLPMAIGADLGMWQGGSIANGGEMNPFKWDYSSGKTWGYMLGGAVTGAISSYTGNTIATSPGFFSNTAGLAASSLVNSLGTNIYTGGETDISISLGIASYNFTSNEWGYLGKEGNSKLQNFSYFLGGMSNLADINLLINKTKATLYTEEKDVISHSAVVDENGSTLMSYGPNDNKFDAGTFKGDFVEQKPILQDAASYKKFGFAIRKSTSNYHVYTDLPVELYVNKHVFTGVRGLGKILPYQGVSINCTNMASIPLWLNGIPNIGIHPYLLYGSTWAYSNGIRLDLLSHYLNW